MKDLHTHIAPVVAVAPAVLAATATSAAIDLQGFNSATVVIATGAIVGDGAFSAKLQHSDTTAAGGFTDVPANGVLGETPSVLEADAAYTLGYVGGSAGHKRYLRIILTKDGGTSLAASAVVVRGHPTDTPA